MTYQYMGKCRQQGAMQVQVETNNVVMIRVALAPKIQSTKVLHNSNLEISTQHNELGVR